MMSYFCGIDIGASTAKLVIIDDAGEMVAKTKRHSGVNYVETADRLLEAALKEGSLDRSQVIGSLSTGYGRNNVPWVKESMTEIACHSKGAYFHYRQRMTVIDIGAQDSKIIHLDDDGRRLEFKMNRKCAAGTGAFVEEIAHRLGLDVSELNDLAESATKDLTLGSYCTVFTATEVLEKIRAGEQVSNIVRGAFRSVVKRIVEMDHRVEGRLVTTGGVVAHNPFMAQLLGEAFGTVAIILPNAQFAGAFGAALFAREKAEIKKESGNDN
jgi:predicted CoA-substrate-specific enzyme activase